MTTCPPPTGRPAPTRAMHPLQLHALAALAALEHALQLLTRATYAERYGLGASDSPRYAAARIGTGRGGGGHGDPVGQVVADSTSQRHARRARWTHDTLAWLVDRLGLPAGEPVAQLRAALPRLRPLTAHELTRWLSELDRRARDELGIGEEPRWPVEGACRACGVHLLYRVRPGLVLCGNVLCVCAGCDVPLRDAGPGRRRSTHLGGMIMASGSPPGFVWVGNAYACQTCGCLCPDSWTILLAHKDYHEALDKALAALRADERRRTAGEITGGIEAWRAANDFARSPDWYAALDAALDVARGVGGSQRDG